MSDGEVLKESVLVLSHVEAKAAELGGGIGLLIALPGLALAPMKANPNDLPPLVAAASLAGTGALIGAAIITPHAIYRMYQGGKQGVHTRALDLRSNDRQKFVDRMALIGAAAGVALESVRIRAISRVHDVPVTSVVTTRDSLWELFGFAVAGAAVAAGTTTFVKLIADKLSDAADKTDLKGNADEMRELVESSAEDVRQSVQSAADQAANAADNAVETVQKNTPSPSSVTDESRPLDMPDGNSGSAGIVDRNA